MIDIPIIFVHRGNKFYLKPVLEQAYAFNKDTTIYLIGDSSNNKYDFLKHSNLSDYSSSADRFEKIYQHMSTNLYEYELFCFQRWFIIQEFVEKHNLEYFLCIDSDYLLFCNVQKVFCKYIKYDFTILEEHCPCTTLFSRKKLNDFCSFIIKLYTDPIYFNILENRYNKVRILNMDGGISDMDAFYYYQKYISNNVLDLNVIDENKEMFDGNINNAQKIFKRNKRGQKAIYWKKNRPYCIIEKTNEKVYLKGIHLQGNAKLDIYNYIVDENTKRGIIFRIKTFFSIKYLHKRYRSYRVYKKTQKEDNS